MEKWQSEKIALMYSFYKDARIKLPNNWLKLHGYPMSRTLPRKHRRFYFIRKKKRGKIKPLAKHNGMTARVYIIDEVHTWR